MFTIEQSIRCPFCGDVVEVAETQIQILWRCVCGAIGASGPPWDTDEALHELERASGRAFHALPPPAPIGDSGILSAGQYGPATDRGVLDRLCALGIDARLEAHETDQARWRSELLKSCGRAEFLPPIPATFLVLWIRAQGPPD